MIYIYRGPGPLSYRFNYSEERGPGNEVVLYDGITKLILNVIHFIEYRASKLTFTTFNENKPSDY